MFELVSLIVVLVGVALGIWGVSRHFRRRRSLGSLALHLRLRFSPGDPADLMGVLGHFHLLRRGHSGRAYNVMRGKRQDRRLVVFDYAYEVGAGLSRCTCGHSVIAWQVGGEFPGMVGTRESRFSALGPFRRFAASETGDEAFDREYTVYTEDPGAIASVLRGPVRRQLRECAGLDWESRDGWWVFYSAGLLRPLVLARSIARTGRCVRRLAYVEQNSGDGR